MKPKSEYNLYINAGNLNLTASNVSVGGDSVIKTAGNFNLSDAKETLSYSSKQSSLQVESGAKVGNAYVDAAYAWKAVADAQKQAIKSAGKLKKMEKLREDGRATNRAVELAAAQLSLAQVAVGTATIAASTATAGAASAAATSAATGVYGAGYMNTTSSGVKNTSESSISKGSTFTTNGDVDVASNKNINVTGSKLSSVNGDVNLSAKDDVNIKAGENMVNQTSKQETVYGGGSIGNNGVQLNIGTSQGESDYNKTFYTNSQISAEGGSLNTKSGNDTNVSGANLLAKNIILNTGNNLNVESKQTEEDYSSNGLGFNVGVGVGSGDNGNSKSYGFNLSNADMHRLWTDDITTIKGTDSLAANVGKDLNLTGGAILSNNLALNVSGNTNKKDLKDSYTSESSSFGISRESPNNNNNNTNKSQTTIIGEGNKPNPFPEGKTTISGSYNQNESSRTTYATIGNLNSQLTSKTKDKNGGEFEGSITLDDRLFSDQGRESIIKDLSNTGRNLKTMREEADKSPLKIGAILNAPNTLLEGAIYTFAEEKNKEGGSRLIIRNTQTEEIEYTTDAAVRKFYALNGINNTPQDIIDSYFINKDGSKVTTLIERENPTHGVLGDLVESGFGKVAHWVGADDAIAMNRIAKEDMHDRKDIKDAVNLYHSQGTIIGKSAMTLYAKDYMKPIQTTDTTTKKTTTTYTNQIDQTQKFVAVGPAVLKEDWRKMVETSLHLNPKVNADYKHDDQDPVRYLSAPSNIINQTAKVITGKEINSPIYIPNLLELPIGIWNAALHMDKHSVTNPIYSQFLKSPNEKNSQIPSTGHPK